MTPHTQGQLVWTRDKPQDEGWWWIAQDGRTPQVVIVRRIRAYGNRLCAQVDTWQPLDDIPATARWAGPIPLPVEPKDGGG